MLTFEEKQAILSGYPQLEKREVSLKRLNYHFPESRADKQIVVYHLHPNGNGFVYVGRAKKYRSYADERGMVNIRDANEAQLRATLDDAIAYLSEEPASEEEAPVEERWVNGEGMELVLLEENGLWNAYHGLNLEETSQSYAEAAEYLEEEGFRRADGGTSA